MKKVNLLIVVLALVGFALPSFANEYGFMTGSSNATCSAAPQINTGDTSKIADGDLSEDKAEALAPAITGSEHE